MSDKTQTKKVNFILRNKKSGFSIHNVFMPIISLLNAPYHEAPCERADIKGIFKNLKWTRKIAKRNCINHMTGGPHYFLLAIPFYKNILTIHDLVLLRNSLGIKHFIFKWFWFKLPLKSACAITCISDTVRKELLQTIKVNPEKVITIHNPVSPLFKFTDHQFRERCPKILQIGTEWNKNTINLIKALQGVSCKLIIVGKLKKDICDELQHSGINYENYNDIANDKLYALYQQADIISFPSIFEGFGMPIIEGQSVGRAVLTSNIAPMTEVAGEGACFVDPHSIDSIRNGFLKIIHDPKYREEIIKKGTENVKKYKLEYITAQYNKLYQKIYENSI